MKLRLCFLGLLCLFLRAAAQEKITYKGLQIGDRVPSGVLGLNTSGRLLLLDFWATWCAPCRAMIPRLDSLQRVFKDQLLVLPVAYESQKIIAPVEAAMHKQWNYQFEREIVGDTVLVKLFPHRELPHYVWISGDGIVLAITENKEVTAGNVRKLLAGSAKLAQKQDITLAYDKKRPLFLGGNGGDGSTVSFSSMLSPYVPGLVSGLEVTTFEEHQGQRFTMRNLPLWWIYRFAFGDGGRYFPTSRIQFATKDPASWRSGLTGQAYRDWMIAGNGWCYELVLPPAMADSVYVIMREQLTRLFPAYKATVEKQVRQSWVLTRTSANDKLKSIGGQPVVEIGPFSAHLKNVPLNQLMMRLEHQYLQLLKEPLADATGYSGPVDLDIEGSLSDLKVLNAALAKYDLAFVLKDHTAEVLVIRDK